MSESQPSQSSGPATDRRNDPVVDPTKNVLDLVEAAVKRQDDLRAQEARHTHEMGNLRTEYATAVLKMTTEHAQDLRDAEAKRIDAIRAVDVGNVQRAAEVQAGVAAALEAKVATTATAFESRLTATIEPIQRRIDDLTRAQYEAQGQKTQVVETQAKGGNVALWIGLAIAAMAFFSATLIGGITLVVLLTQ